MKKIISIILFAIAFFGLNANGQIVTVNYLSSIKPGARINYSVDFSQATILGMTEEDFSMYEKDWQEDKPSIIGRLLKGINARLDDILRIGAFKNSPYKMKVVVTNVTEVGNVFCDATIEDNQGTILFQVRNVNGGKEPPFLPGTKLAKIKVWVNLTGRSLGGIIKSEYLNN